MSPRSACIVKHKLTRVVASISAYTSKVRGTEPFWAEPDIDDAAIWMSRLAADRALTASIGKRAKRAFDHYQQKASRLGFIDDVLAIREHNLAQRSDALRIKDRERRIHALLDFVRRDTMPLPQWLLWAARQQYEKHVGWRLAPRS